jgi:hypothetical protein
MPAFHAYSFEANVVFPHKFVARAASGRADWVVGQNSKTLTLRFTLICRRTRPQSVQQG